MSAFSGFTHRLDDRQSRQFVEQLKMHWPSAQRELIAKSKTNSAEPSDAARKSRDPNGEKPNATRRILKLAALWHVCRNDSLDRCFGRCVFKIYAHADRRTDMA